MSCLYYIDSTNDMDTSALITIIAFLTSALCSFIFILAILRFCEARNIYDFPDARKIHSKAVPRLGGISFIPSMLISFVIALSVIKTEERLVTLNLWSLYFLMGITLIFLMGMIDDFIGLAPLCKFGVQIVAACTLPLSGLYIDNLHGTLGLYEIPHIFGILLTILIVVFITNAINLIDGIDGLAAGLSLLAFLGFLWSFMRQGDFTYSTLTAGLIGVLVSFLYFNLFGDMEKKTKIFMGDSGSLTLGFILGFLCVKCSKTTIPCVPPCDDVEFIMAYSLVLVPMLDAARVFIVRIAHHVSPFKADNRHIHHKLMRLGLTQRQALITILVIAIGYLPLNHLLVNVTDNTITIGADILVYTLLNIMLNGRELSSNEKKR